ncbi:MAG TPA: MarR family winged helix-turn-helix transcriptional regulator [Acidobacteriaceae bacterium]|nr:MarR family winged helix-turn-helix transcriptional regulator [Acidobacteriaceae bacterium]
MSPFHADSRRYTEALAEFRSTLRAFLRFSEEAAVQAGLTPQQHQLLLQIAGAPEGTGTTVGYLAEKLALRHNSVVELGDRCVEAGLAVRLRDGRNRRHVVLKLTDQGASMLQKLSEVHYRELNELGPQLIGTLKTLIG